MSSPDENETVSDDSTEGSEAGPVSSSLFAELKRRKVFRVAATYAVVAWLIIQVASATFSGFGIPTWAFRFVVMMLILGFPVALLLAWAFELTPDGIKLTKNVDHADEAHTSKEHNRKRNWMSLGFAAGLPTVIFGTLALYFYFDRNAADQEFEPTAARPYAIGRIAVLPFELIGGTDKSPAIASGIEEEMLTQLSGMSPLDVVSRTSTLRYRDRSEGIREIGRELGADYIVEGSLQESGTRWKVTLQLIASKSDHHVWADTFEIDQDPDLTALYLQKEIAWELAISVYRQLAAIHPPKGRSRQLRDAELAKRIAEAKAMGELFWGFDGGQREFDVYESLIERYDRISSLDPLDASSYLDRAMVLGNGAFAGKVEYSDQDWSRERLLTLNKAFFLEPDHSKTCQLLGEYYLLNRNRPAKALVFLRRAVENAERDQNDTGNWPYYHLASALNKTGNSPAAIEVLKEVPFEPDFDIGHYQFWISSYTLGRRFEALIAFLEEKLREKGSIANPIDLALVEYALAQAESSWIGSLEPQKKFADKIKDEPLPPAIKAQVYLECGDYEKALEYINLIQGRMDSIEFVPDANSVGYLRAVCLYQIGNHALAEPYVRGSLRAFEEEDFAQWQKSLNPASYFATIANLYVMLGENETAREYLQRAKGNFDPSRNFEQFIDAVVQTAIGYFELEDVGEASALADLLLSSPTGISLGAILVGLENEPLWRSQAIENMARKHRNQLKDPLILDRYFSVE